VDIIPLLVGAGLAIAGGLVGQLVGFYLKREEQRRTFRRDKLDQLMVALSEDEHWIHEFRRAMCYGNGEYPTAEPFDRVKATVHLYFVERLGTAIIPLVQRRSAFAETIRLAHLDRINRAMAAGKPSINTTPPAEEKVNAVMSAHQPYYQACLEFRQNCSAVAQNFS
jgi:hypothetical protein